MSDDDLLGYLTIHCRTELGMTSKVMLRRLFDLAGEDAPPDLDRRAFWNTSPEVIDPLVEKARERMK